MKLFFKRLNKNAVIPERATSGSAGIDLCACIDSPIVIESGEIALIPTGLSAQPENTDVALMLYPRSGLASRYGIALANCVGVVDSDYRGEICVPLINHGKKSIYG
jgi:dUTP pyrophosphatase